MRAARIPPPTSLRCLVSSPPHIVVSLLRRVVDKLRAGVERTLREHVLGDLPGLEVGHLHCGVVANVDAEVDTVEARRVDARCQPEAVLSRVSICALRSQVIG